MFLIFYDYPLSSMGQSTIIIIATTTLYWIGVFNSIFDFFPSFSFSFFQGLLESLHTFLVGDYPGNFGLFLVNMTIPYTVHMHSHLSDIEVSNLFWCLCRCLTWASLVISGILVKKKTLSLKVKSVLILENCCYM